MPHKLEYRFREGETLHYRQVVTMVMDQTDGQTLGGRSIFDLTQEIVEDHGGHWTVDFQYRLTEKEGVLCESIPETLQTRGGVVQMDLRGTLLDIDQGPPPPRVPAFPLEAVQEGDAWVSVERTGATPQPLEIQWILERFEESPGEIIAHLVSIANSEDPDEGLSTSVEGATQFSITEGCQNGSTTVIRMNWTDGRSMQIVVDLSLISRTPSSRPN